MTKEEAKEFIEEKRQVEIRIRRIETKNVSDMTIGELYNNLVSLMFLGGERCRLETKIKSIERLA